MLPELVGRGVAVADSVAEAADLEELEVVLGAVDLFSRRRRAEFSTLPTLAIFFPPGGNGKTWEPRGTFSYAPSH